MNNTKVLAILIFLAVFVFIGWFFSDILIYMLIAIILSLLGNPLVKLLRRIKIKNWHVPQSLAAVITLIVIITVITTFLYFIIPLIIKELKYLSTIDPTIIATGISNWLSQIEEPLISFGIITSDQHLVDIFSEKIMEMVNQINFSNIFGDAISFVSSFFIAVFSILFMTFFSLKDNKIFFNLIKKLIPISFRDNFQHILSTTQKQLVKYFSGVFVEMIIIGCMEGLICYFLNVPNALLIGFIGGLLNIIPYVGPLIATGIGVVISITSLMPSSPEEMVISYTIIKVLAAFIISKLCDDFLLQPIIYGKSVQAHPLEIFIIILIAGYVGGVVGMIFAVPAYSLIRIIVNEFFSQYYPHTDEPISSEEELPPVKQE